MHGHRQAEIFGKETSCILQWASHPFQDATKAQVCAWSAGAVLPKRADTGIDSNGNGESSGRHSEAAAHEGSRPVSGKLSEGKEKSI